ncbi:hypothetical protein ACFQX6_29475 [Streptosporangium lutulentum]
MLGHDQDQADEPYGDHGRGGEFAGPRPAALQGGGAGQGEQEAGHAHRLHHRQGAVLQRDDVQGGADRDGEAAEEPSGAPDQMTKAGMGRTRRLELLQRGAECEEQRSQQCQADRRHSHAHSSQADEDTARCPKRLAEASECGLSGD